MNKFEFAKKITLTEEDLIDILCACLEGGCNYWLCVDNGTPEWESMRESMPEGYTFEDIFYKLLHTEKGVRVIDEEEGEVYYLHIADYIKGIQMVLDNNFWNGEDVCDVDGFVGDAIIQYAIFGEQVYA